MREYPSGKAKLANKSLTLVPETRKMDDLARDENLPAESGELVQLSIPGGYSLLIDNLSLCFELYKGICSFLYSSAPSLRAITILRKLIL